MKNFLNMFSVINKIILKKVIIKIGNIHYQYLIESKFNQDKLNQLFGSY